MKIRFVFKIAKLVLPQLFIIFDQKTPLCTDPKTNIRIEIPVVDYPDFHIFSFTPANPKFDPSLPQNYYKQHLPINNMKIQ